MELIAFISGMTRNGNVCSGHTDLANGEIDPDRQTAFSIGLTSELFDELCSDYDPENPHKLKITIEIKK